MRTQEILRRREGGLSPHQAGQGRISPCAFPVVDWIQHNTTHAIATHHGITQHNATQHTPARAPSHTVRSRSVRLPKPQDADHLTARAKAQEPARFPPLRTRVLTAGAARN